ncbi:MAG: aminotransferase class III-fold pyridoxal phosphate-dependent enzyme [Clostridia bacterium]
MKTYTYEKCDAMLQRAAKVIPSGIYGHLGPGEGCFIPISAFPKFVDHAKGAHFWDLDGNRFIDYMCAYGPNVLGYCDDDVDAAAIEQSRIGNCTTNPSVKMVELAELMVDTVASADWAFFAKNGGDVTTLSIITARAATGRKKIVFTKGYYHGVTQWAQRKDNPGILDEDVANNIVINWNDPAAFERAIAENPGQIAAFISTPYMHGNFIENELPADGYWQRIRKLCTDNGIVLIIDDVRCGFRLDLAGSDHYYGFQADMICFCKALANGWNVSCLCGKDFLKGTVSAVSFTGSYWMSAVPFAAGIACINKMKAMDGANRHLALGKKITDGLQNVARKNGAKLIVSGEPSLFYLHLAMDESLLIHQEWIAEMVRRGVFMANHHNHFTNLSLSDEDIAFTMEVADEALGIVKSNHPEAGWITK